MAEFNSEIYELAEERFIQDIHSQGTVLRHKKSGARICLLENEDENKVFFVGFRTPPKDDCGTPHIIEHTVLCGSRKFPLKDPFIELAKGSLNTFLNAVTFPDKTLYPVASCNDADFKNLMDVYLDSVFYPNIYKNENIFRQEGWHYEIDDAQGELTVNGIVYNEMKGAYSSPEGILERQVYNALYPDTPYAKESGGDPKAIPNLSYEAYLDFHRTYYHPSNSYIYLYGNLDMTERLEWLDREYLSAFDKISVDSEIPDQPVFCERAESECFYPIPEEDEETDQTYLSLSWMIGNNADPLTCMAMDVLDHTLLNRQGAPIKQALIDAGIGDEIEGGYDNSIRQPYFMIIAKNANPEQKEDFIRIIYETLEEEIKKGLPEKTILATLNRDQFRTLEADYGRMPKGLIWGLSVMNSWLYYEENPFRQLESTVYYDRLRQYNGTGYFEELIQKEMIDNPHTAFVMARPKKGLVAEQEKELSDALKAYKQTLSKEEIEELIAKEAAVHAFGETPSTKEELDTIPLLHREDMKAVSDPFHNTEDRIGTSVSLLHDIQTNDIVYQDWVFDISHLNEDELFDLSVYFRLLGKLDTADYSFRDLSDELNLYTGGTSSALSVSSDLRTGDKILPKFEWRMRALARNYKKARDLTASILLRTDFSDTKRVAEILAELRSQYKTDLSADGMSIAINRAQASFNRRAVFNDRTDGISFYRRLCETADAYTKDPADLTERLNRIRQLVQHQDNLIISTTCEAGIYARICNDVKELAQSFPNDATGPARILDYYAASAEAFTDASQIQYVALAGHFDTAKHVFGGTHRIFKTIMSYEYLWDRIRVKGGAYGCSAGVTRTGEVAFASYRDPNLAETLQVYREVVDYLESFEADERRMTKFIIGTFSELDRPLMPKALGRVSLSAYISGLTYETVQREREEVLQAKAADIRALGTQLREVLENAQICVVGNEGKIRENAELFDMVEALV